MEPQILRHNPFANSGKAGDGLKNNWSISHPMSTIGKGKAREGSPSIKLGLGICAESGRSSHMIKRGKFAFTQAQLHELHHQDLIFKHIVAGLTVPFHLVLPIWKSVNSFGSDNGGLYNQYPSFIRYSPQVFDNRSIMDLDLDPEPGRCRTTDGKKWRCSRKVVPDQNYREQHMHNMDPEPGRCRRTDGKKWCSRNVVPGQNYGEQHIHNMDPEPVRCRRSDGKKWRCIRNAVPSHSYCEQHCRRGRRRCSRKLVEASGNVSPESMATTSTNPFKTIPTIDSNSTDNINPDNNMSIPIKIQLATSSSNTGNMVPTNATVATTAVTSNSNACNNGDRKRVNANKDGYRLSRSRSNIGSNGINDDFRNCVNDNQSLNRGSNYGSNCNFGPKSVLQVAMRHNIPSFNYGNITKPPELQRCKRTDGRKWRCNINVVPDEKYCGRHIHRGRKKLVPPSLQEVTIATPITTHATHVAPIVAIPEKADDSMNPNTNLSISIQTSPQPQPIANEEKSCASSDATTVSDEISSVPQRFALSQ